MNGWQWGQAKYHHALIRHPLAEIATPDVRATLNVGPYPRGGDSYTVSATGGADNQTSGGSLKIIADTENWDNSLGLNNPGQSGDPGEPALPRPVRDLVARQVLPDLLQPAEGRVGHGGAAGAHAAGSEHGRAAGQVGGRAPPTRRHRAGRRCARQKPSSADGP